jgi:anthranilate synthase component 1
MSFLLESVEGGEVRGRYSIIGLEPDIVLRAFADRAEINRAPRETPDTFTPEALPTLASLRALLDASRIETPSDLPPMAAGVFGYFGYDNIRLIERLPNTPPDTLGVPDAILVRPTVMVIFDAVKDEMMLVTPVYPQPKGDPSKAYEAARARLANVVAGLDAPLPHHARTVFDPLEAPEPVSNTTPDEYLAMVERCKEYIAAGDAFQIVVSQRFSAPFTLPPLALYRALRRTNPSPFLFHLDFGGFALVGSSPEILVRVRGGEVTIRPLAGTRPRGATSEEDKALEAELLADPKERAEHLMLLDLGRNDVGRVAEIGTVRVTESFAVERYSHVMHIVSHVVGALDKRHDVIDALMAGFPAGTLSGAAAQRAQEKKQEHGDDHRRPKPRGRGDS